MAMAMAIATIFDTTHHNHDRHHHHQAEIEARQPRINELAQTMMGKNPKEAKFLKVSRRLVGL